MITTRSIWDGVLLLRHQRTTDQVLHPLGNLIEISNFYTNCKEKKRQMKEEGISEKEVK